MQDPIGCTGKKIMIEWEHLHPMRRAVSAAGGKNEKAGAKTMGISHEYHSTSHRARHGGVSGKLRLAGVVLAILVLAYAITAILENGASAKDAPSEPVASGIAQDILAPLPMQGEAADSDSSGDSTAPDGSGDAQAVTLETFGPARQDAAAAVVKAYDASVIRQPSCGQVDLNYFADAAFLGDSLTVGFSDYRINLGGALVCGYTGVGPDAIVNRTAVKSSVRGEEIALDVLAAAQPAKLYILIGTNALVQPGNDDSFLAYYGKMLDDLRTALPDTTFYVQSVLTATQEKVSDSLPGLAPDRLAVINAAIQQLCAERGCYYLDLNAEFADDAGYLQTDFSQPDGVHLTVSGYSKWVSYLCTHVPYSKNNPYQAGSTYYLSDDMKNLLNDIP